MMTSSTSSLLPANTPTTNLPPTTTTKLPPATFTTTNLPSAPTSTTTSHLPPATSSTNHLPPSTSTAKACNINEADLFVVPVVGEENLLIEAEIEELDDVTMNEDVEANVILEPDQVYTFTMRHLEERHIGNQMLMSRTYLLRGNVLMRTTSRSESENAFFKNFTNHGSTLVNFMMCFESAMERQCYRQEVLDFRTFDSAPKLHTKLTIEIHACKVYTRTISLLVQKEIYEGVWACQIQDFKKEEGCEIVKVRDIRAGAYRTLYTEEGKETVIQEKDKVVDYKNCNIEVIPKEHFEANGEGINTSLHMKETK
ncbi:FAR1-related sequence 5-like protein [Tanacetum coccineum]